MKSPKATGPESITRQNTKDVKLLDCTLRDGGHVNGWLFGEEVIKGIINRLSSAGVDIIELGLVKDITHSKDYTLQPSIAAFAELAEASSARPDQYFTVMIRPDWVQSTSIDEYSSHGIVNGIRFAFYPEDIVETLNQANIARERGYDVFLNAVGVSCYETSRLISIIKQLTALKPIALSIVDTFGSFDIASLTSYYKIFEDHTDPDIAIGLHLHENRSLALTLAMKFLELKVPPRAGILDASLFGMGRIPGNLCIEQIAQHLNTGIVSCHAYDIPCLMNGIERYIFPIRARCRWGYSPEYMLSAIRNINRNYPEYFMTNGLALEDMSKALDCVKEAQGESFKYLESIAKHVALQFIPLANKQ